MPKFLTVKPSARFLWITNFTHLHILSSFKTGISAILAKIVQLFDFINFPSTFQQKKKKKKKTLANFSNYLQVQLMVFSWTTIVFCFFFSITDSFSQSLSNRLLPKKKKTHQFARDFVNRQLLYLFQSPFIYLATSITPRAHVPGPSSDLSSSNNH